MVGEIMSLFLTIGEEGKKKDFRKEHKIKEEKIKKGGEQEENEAGVPILRIWIRRRSSFHRGRDGGTLRVLTGVNEETPNV